MGCKETKIAVAVVGGSMECRAVPESPAGVCLLARVSVQLAGRNILSNGALAVLCCSGLYIGLFPSSREPHTLACAIVPFYSFSFNSNPL